MLLQNSHGNLENAFHRDLNEKLSKYDNLNKKVWISSKGVIVTTNLNCILYNWLTSDSESPDSY